MTPSRKLIGKKAVAHKLDMSANTFETHREKLEKTRGFPPPVLNTDLFGARKWDEHAIDLWIDQFIPPHLTQPQTNAGINVLSIEQELMENAAALAI